MNYLLIPLKDVLVLPAKFSKPIQDNLMSFECKNDKEIEWFLRKKIINAERSADTRSYIYVDKKTLDVLGFFSLGIDSVTIKEAGVSVKDVFINSKPFNINKIYYGVYLLGQFARNDKFVKADIDGKTMMLEGLKTINTAWDIIGGRAIVLDCYPIMYEKFYKSLGFQPFDYCDAKLIEQDTKLFSEKNLKDRVRIKLVKKIENFKVL